MENNANKYITVSYELYVDNDGKEVMMEKAPVEHPFQFISGMGITLESFEANIAKLAQGDAFDFVIPVAEAYGEIDPEHIRGNFDMGRYYYNIALKIEQDPTASNQEILDKFAKAKPYLEKAYKSQPSNTAAKLS